MASEIKPQIVKLGEHAVLCDAEFSEELTADLFDPEQLERQGLLTGRGLGRGEAWFFHVRGRNWVLRHFRRGGLVGRIISDRYLGCRPEQSRSWSEWRLLAELYQRGLPVPRPVAASVRCGFGSYRADLLTEQIPDALSLAAHLAEQPLLKELWVSIGACLRRFHEQGICHADLNANNILIDGRAQIHLIDFDRGSIRPAGDWSRQNLQRLKRSLLKIQGNSVDFHYSEQDWQHLQQGYQASCR